MKKIHYIAIVIVLLLAGGISICCINPQRPLASDYVRTTTHATAVTENSGLRTAIDPESQAHPGQSGFKLIIKGEDSLSIRIAAIEAAEHSLDIQYYLIQDDITGKLLLETVLRAADRGVRVRILMDDLNLHGGDKTWMLLNAHENIEIRIFNPFATRDEPLFTRISNVFTGFRQFSKRMHNKVLIADNQIGITGGRNLGDAYFDASSDFNFRDIDVLAVGPIIAAMSRSFDKYWNNDEAFPIAVLYKITSDVSASAKLREQLKNNWREALQKGMFATPLPLAVQIKNEQVPLIWADAELAADKPSKIDLPPGLVESNPAANLDKIAQATQHEFIIVSPYFVPGAEGTQALKAMVAKGVAVKVLTNSLASTDAVAAHTGYRHYRQALVEGGVDLYEMEPVGRPRPHSHRFSSASRNSLHSKMYIADRRDVIIGSFNLDPRSIHLNTETVLVIHSTVLAEQLATMFEKATSPEVSFQVAMRDGHLAWIDGTKDNKKYYAHEPEAGFWQPIEADILALLPLGEQL